MTEPAAQPGWLHLSHTRAVVPNSCPSRSRTSSVSLLDCETEVSRDELTFPPQARHFEASRSRAQPEPHSPRFPPADHLPVTHSTPTRILRSVVVPLLTCDNRSRLDRANHGPACTTTSEPSAHTSTRRPRGTPPGPSSCLTGRRGCPIISEDPRHQVALILRDRVHGGPTRHHLEVARRCLCPVRAMWGGLIGGGGPA